jgi:hypothetical protein
LAKYSPTGQAQWVTSIKGSNLGGTYGTTVCVDSSSNAYVSGIYSGSNIIYNSNGLASALTLPNITNNTNFIVKYNSLGQAEKAFGVNGTLQVQPYDSVTYMNQGPAVACIDPSGNIYMAGAYGSSATSYITFSNSVTSNLSSLTGTGTSNAFLAKFTSLSVSNAVYPTYTLSNPSTSNFYKYLMNTSTSNVQVTVSQYMSNVSSTLTLPTNVMNTFLWYSNNWFPITSNLNFGYWNTQSFLPLQPALNPLGSNSIQSICLFSLNSRFGSIAEMTITGPANESICSLACQVPINYANITSSWMKVKPQYISIFNPSYFYPRIVVRYNNGIEFGIAREAGNQLNGVQNLRVNLGYQFGIYGTNSVSDTTATSTYFIDSNTYNNLAYLPLNYLSQEDFTTISSNTMYTNANVSFSNNINVSGTANLSNVNIYGILTVSNVEYVTSNITIYNSETINSNLNVLNTITSATLSNTGNMYSSTFSNVSGISTATVVSTTLSNTGGLSTGTLASTTLSNTGNMYSSTFSNVYGISTATVISTTHSNTGGLSTGALAVASNIAFSNATGTTTLYSVGNSLGVGKSNPAYTLDVLGNINFTGALTSNGVAFSGGGGGSTQWSNWNCNVFIGTSSNVGIGMSNPGYTLQVGGTIYASGDITAFSDARFKTNIVQISNSLDTVCKMNGYYYNRTDYEDVKQDKDKKHMGFLAQEVMEVVPEIVEHDVVNDHYSVKYGNTVALLVEAIKEMRKEITDLKSMIVANK